MVRLSYCVKHHNFFATSLFATKIHRSIVMTFMNLPRKFEVKLDFLIEQTNSPVHRAVA